MKLLAIFAHPDDESYGPAGTLAWATRNGHEVSLLTLTHGESGSLGISKFLSANELAKHREQELRCAANKLGIRKVMIQNLPDKHLKDLEEQIGINIITREIKKFQPDILVTFHENGISGHPDHQTVAQWTLKTIKSFQNSPRLFYFGISPQQAVMVTFRKLFPIEDKEITHSINVEDFISDKIEAIRCHRTQISLWQQFQNQAMDFVDRKSVV